MSRKADKIKELDDCIILKANKPLNKTEFDLLSDMVKSEHKETGKKIILMPYSADLVEGDK